MALEANVAAIEAGRAGFAFASGMAAIDAVLTRLEAGDHLVVSDNTYGGTFRLFERVRRKFGLDFTYVDTSRLDAIAPAFTAKTKYLFMESPTNPMLSVTDIAAASEIAHRHGVRVVVDNTFASPYVQRPLALGADIVLHSTTKFLNGHSDSVGGVVVVAHQDDEDWLRFVQNAAGAILGPMDSWLVLRGTKTLPIRMERTNANTLRIAEFLAAHPRVTRTIYPGPGQPPAPCPGGAADAGLRRAGVLRRRLARPRPRGAGPVPADGAGRKPRRRGDAHLPPGDHDPRLGPARAADGAGHQRRADPHLGGD